MSNLVTGLVSIIIPVYNIENHIGRCLDSIINQDYKKIEIIVVDDGSFDNSRQIIMSYKKNDNRIKYFYKKNGGLSSARNYGINKATGQFIAFIDGDDWVEESYVSKNISVIKKDDSDLVVSNITYIYDNGKKKRRVPRIKKNNCIDRNAAIKKLLNGNEYKFHIVNKFCKTEIFKKNHIEFPIDRIYEDMFTTYKVFKYAKRISLCNNSLYYYLQNRKGSILNTRFNEKRFDILAAMDVILNDSIIRKCTTKKDRQNLYLINILSLASYICTVDNSITIMEYINRITKDKNFRLLNGYLLNNNVKTIDKAKMLVFKACPMAYVNILKRIGGH